MTVGPLGILPRPSGPTQAAGAQQGILGSGVILQMLLGNLIAASANTMSQVSSHVMERVASRALNLPVQNVGEQFDRLLQDRMR